MPATFTLSERERIDAKMRQASYKLFTTQGLKKTSLEEITSIAGVAKSSFYVFFSSKEHLYLELLATEAPAIKNVSSTSLKKNKMLVKLLKDFFAPCSRSLKPTRSPNASAPTVMN